MPRSSIASEDQRPLLRLGSEELEMRSEGRIQEIARRVRREGLPLARLWENHGALLSLGLNQRGKPGLWLIQKTR